jgi:hypothetical protein
MTMPAVGIAIVSYNTRDLLHECLTSVMESSHRLADHGIAVDVCVVDNASSDGSADMVASEFPAAKLIRSPTNDGFGAASNRAMHEIDATYILLLNPETKVSAHVLLRCWKYAETNPDVGIVGCRIELPDGSLDRACKRGIPTPFNALCYFTKLDRVFPNSAMIGGYNATHIDETQCADVGAVVGAFMWVRSRVLRDVGYFDEEFFMYGEDLDLCFRAHKAGWRISYLGDCCVYHVKGASSGIAGIRSHAPGQDRALRVRMVTEFHRAMLIFYRKHYDDQYSAIVWHAVRAAVGVRCWFATRRESRREPAAG